MATQTLIDPCHHRNSLQDEQNLRYRTEAMGLEMDRLIIMNVRLTGAVAEVLAGVWSATVCCEEALLDSDETGNRECKLDSGPPI
jgi:hypothetical protein